jgi:CHAT domain-containing protein/Tfp pilus assembly protein PilF
MRTLSIASLLLFVMQPVLSQHRDSDVIRQIDRLLLNARIDEAMTLIESTSATSPSALLENKKGESLIRMGKFDEAASLFESVMSGLASDKDSFLKAVTMGNIGFLQLNRGRTDLAESSLQEALREFQQSGEGSSAAAAQALSNLGLVYMSMGKYSQAQEQLHQALSIRESVVKNDELIAATYNDLGLVYSQTDKDRAIDYFEKALKMYRALYGDIHAKIAIANINLGIVYREMEFYGDAANDFDAALKIANEVYPGPHPTKAIALYNLGQTYVGIKDEHAAAAYYAQAHDMYVACYGEKHPEVAAVLNAIGNLQVSASNFNDALHTYQQALEANFPDFSNDDVAVNPPLKDYYHGTRLLYTLMFKEQAFEGRYLGKSLKFHDLALALTILNKCDSLIDHLRQHSANELDKLRLGAIANEVYTDGVRIAGEAALNAVSKEKYLRLAFYFAEKSKSAVLLESISDANAKSFAGIPDSLIEREKELKSALAVTAERLAQKPSKDDEKKLREMDFKLKEAYQKFIADLERDFPEYFNLKFNLTTPTVESLQSLLNDRTALLSYFVDEKRSQLYIFLISKKHYKVVQRPLTMSLDKYITGLRNSLYFEDMKTFKEAAYKLGSLLLPPMPSAITDIVVIPAGKLALVPFETLLTHRPDKITEYRDMPYLAKQFSVRYEFSAGLIVQKEQRRETSHGLSIFLCAPVTFSDRSFSDLPGTATEVKQVSDLFTGRHLTAAAYTGSDADERLVKSSALKRYDFLHFATHGIVDESQPELSRIFLQPYPDSEDGSLYAGEIFNLELNASLVTLSACQTGLGKIQKGEGVIGLSRALVYAGAKNIVVSFWNVADNSTASFMKDFYSNVLTNPASPYSDALRQAKLRMLTSEHYSAPFYWAPFVLIGF